VALDSVLSTPVIPPPPKGTSPAAGSSSGSGSSGDSSSTSTSSTSGSGSAQAADNSSGSASGSATKSSGKGSTASRGAKPSSQAQSASSGSKAQQGNATHQTQATAASGAQGAATQNKNPGPSFIQALAQTQANAQDSATATAAAAPQEVTGSKPKGAKDDHTDTTGTAVGFLSQSLAAAMAGLQSTNPGQNLTAHTTPDHDSTDAISLAGGSSIQSVVANIAQGTAEELAHGSSGLEAATTTAADGKADPSPSSAAPATDNNAAAAAVNAFQAHMASRQSMANTDALSNKVNTPVGNTGFADDVGGRITWMANQGVQSASLQLTPEHLGPVEVRISMQHGSASVSFNAAHADTRAALEQALPRLREMFSTQGLTLTDASVSQQSPRGQPQRQSVSAIGAIGGVSGDDSTAAVATTVTRTQLGLVDTYA
jgi:flagellar hook-length control protein FliK